MDWMPVYSQFKLYQNREIKRRQQKKYLAENSS